VNTGHVPLAHKISVINELTLLYGFKGVDLASNTNDSFIRLVGDIQDVQDQVLSLLGLGLKMV
jgi:hypothetical protein